MIFFVSLGQQRGKPTALMFLFPEISLPLVPSLLFCRQISLACHVPSYAAIYQRCQTIFILLKFSLHLKK